jgi:hypothetical protein
MSKTVDMRSLQVPRRIACPLLAGCLIVLSTVVSIGLAQERAEPAQGELKIEGTHIARLVLRRADGHIEEWSNLSASINLPVGGYRVQQLVLRGNYTCHSQGLTALGQIKVTENEPAVLKAGGPLRQIIEVDRRGRTLVLNYRLRGVGDEEYTPLPAGRAAFAVYQGDKAIASGAFEYG